MDNTSSGSGQASMDSLLAQATEMANQGGPGANTEAANAWLQQQFKARGAQISNPPVSIFEGMPSDKTAKLVPGNWYSKDGKTEQYLPPGYDPTKKAAQRQPQEEKKSFKIDPLLQQYLPEQFQDNKSTLPKPLDLTRNAAENLDVTGRATAAKVGAYFQNFSQLRANKLVSFTPQQLAAAKAVGIPVPYQVGNFSVLDVGSKGFDNIMDVAMKKAGVDPAKFEQSSQDVTSGELGKGNISASIVKNSLISNLVNRIANPYLANTRLYDNVQKATQAISTLNDPKASAAAKKDAAETVFALKAQNGSIGQNLKELAQQFKEDPIKTAKGMLGGIISTPELALLGGGGTAGDVAFGAKAAQASSLAGRMAQKGLAMADKAKLAEISGDTSAGVREGVKAIELGGKALTLKRLQKLGNLGGSVATGAGINAAATAAQQSNEQGYSTPGAVGSSAIAGGVLGALFHGGSEKPITQEHVSPEHTDTAKTRAGAPGDINQPHVPGNPIPTNAPVDDTGTVAYTGGASQNLKKTHIDENFPNTLSYTNDKGQKVELPVKDIVTQVHEAEEAPLMHPKGAVPVEKLAELVQRAGEFADKKIFSKSILKKIAAGEPLSYPDAHNIATAIENNHVESVYGVSAKAYQDGLKPHIKEIAENSEKQPKSKIPVDLDSKPYDDMDHPEVVEGASKQPEVGGAQGGSIFDSLMGQTGKTGALAAAGAVGGAYLADQDKKGQGALGGGLAMFLGRLAKTHDMGMETLAEGMRRAGKSSDEIFAKTGMVQTADGKWAHEISDVLADLRADVLDKTERTGVATPLFNALFHPKLESSYGDILKEVKIKQEKMDETYGGLYDPRTKTITVNRPENLRRYAERTLTPTHMPVPIALHEVQHAVQHAEGWPTGSSPEIHEADMMLVKAQLEEQLPAYQRAIDALRKQGKTQKAKLYQDKYDEIKDKIERVYSPWAVMKEAFRRYQASAGEQQAMSTQARHKLLPEQRARFNPEKGMGVPLEKQNVTYNSRSFSKAQAGSADPEAVKKLALAATVGTLGATAGVMLAGKDDNQLKAAGIGAGLSLAALPFMKEFVTNPIKTAVNVAQGIKEFTKAKSGESIADTIGRWQQQTKQSEIINYRTGKELNKLVPDKASRVKITHALDTGDTGGLTPQEMKGYQFARKFDDQMGLLAQQEGVIKDLIPNHISHLWKNDAAFQRYQEQLQQQIASGMSPKTVFDLQRRVKSIAQGKAIGLTPLTEDVTEILHSYTKSVLQAVRNKQLLAALKGQKDSAGRSYLVMSSRSAPPNYVQINHPQLRGMAVHPTIAPQLRNIFYSYDLNPVTGLLNTLNMGMKRSEVSFSLFHLTSLFDGYLGAMPTFTHPIKTFKEGIRSITGNSSYHAALNGTADPITQNLFNDSLKAGVQYQIPRGQGADVDMNNNYYQGLQHMSNYLDSIIPYAGHIPHAAAAISHIFDHIIFENGMSGMKFAVWMHVRQEMNNSWAEAMRKDPNTKVPSQAEIDRTAAGFTNNILGSQNWLRASQQATTVLGRAWLHVLGSPVGRKISQYLLFAPDWTTSTFMSFMKALGKGSGIGGMIHPKTTADLHRIYQVRSAALYALIGGGLNYAMSGHYIWDNKDPTTIDMGNGQRLQWNKHWTEPYQVLGGALEGNFQAAYNKLGILPHQIAEGLGKKEYINLEGSSPKMRESEIAHILKGFVPIPLQGFGNQTPAQIAWNLAGRNVLGHPTTGPEGQRFKREMENKRKAAAKKAAETRRNRGFTNPYR